MAYTLIPGEDFSEIQTEFNGVNCSYSDALNGKDLSDGESLLVKFPDGTLEEKIVKLKEEEREVSDGNGHFTTWDKEAFINIKIAGMQFEVRLAKVYCDIRLLARRII